MSLADCVVADLLQIERDLGITKDDDLIQLQQTFGWNGVAIPCSPGARNRGTLPGLGGFDVDFEFSLIVRMNHFITFDSTVITVDSELITIDDAIGPAPVAGKVITFPGTDGQQYKVVRARVSALNTHVEIFMADLNG